jgi:hypothetical protein
MLVRVERLSEDWENFDKIWEELFEVYNATKVSEDIRDTLEEVRAFMLRGWEQSRDIKSHLQKVQAERKAEEESKSLLEQEKRLEEMRQRYRTAAAIDTKHSRVANGFIYIVVNDLMPGMVKIGFTAGNPDRRAKEISSQYALPCEFRVVNYWRVADPYIIEQRIHEELKLSRRGGEFFELDFELAKARIDQIIKEFEVVQRSDPFHHPPVSTDRVDDFEGNDSPPRDGWATVIAGIDHSTDRMQAAMKCRVGDKLTLAREPANKFDANAIKILRSSSEQLGYVPRAFARNIAPFLDRGYTAEAVIKSIAESRGHIFIHIAAHGT